MKVYYEFETRDNEQTNLLLNELSKAFKYRIMWELRHLEKEITEEGGIIKLVDKDGKSNLHVKGFSKETIDKIGKIFSQIDFDKW